MDEMKTIEGSNCSRYTNLLHSGFHTRIWQKLRDVEDKTKINVSDELLAEYGENIATETELNREPRADVTSEAIAEAEALRDKAVSYLFNQIEAAKEATIPEVMEAGKALTIVISPYKGLQSLADNAETAGIKGCVQDLRKPVNSNYVITLNIGPAITAADEANQEFERLKIARTEAKKANKKEKNVDVRLRTDANYNRICELIYASQLLCTVPEDKEIISGVIDDINAIVEEFKTSYNMSQGHKDSDTEDPDSEKPDEGEEPTEGTEPGEEPNPDEQEPGGGEEGGGEEPEPDDRPVVQ